MSDRKILNSWKDIAHYIGRGVRTVQRYEASLALPVRRLAGHPRTSVMAFSDEIDAWLGRAQKRSAPAATIPIAIKVPKNGRLKIFLVEDDVEYVDKLRSALTRLGPCDAEVFSDSDKAIYALREVIAGESRAPNLIVLDYELGNSTGLEVLRYYRSNPELKAAVPLIVWTVLDSRTTREMSLWMGAKNFVPKQPGLEPLIAALKSVLPGRAAS